MFQWLLYLSQLPRLGRTWEPRSWAKRHFQAEAGDAHVVQGKMAELPSAWTPSPCLHGWVEQTPIPLSSWVTNFLASLGLKDLLLLVFCRCSKTSASGLLSLG